MQFVAKIYDYFNKLLNELGNGEYCIKTGHLKIVVIYEN